MAVWAVVALIAFFANRGADVGRLGTLVGNLGGGPLFGWEGFRDSLAGIVTAGVVFLSWFGLGTFVTSFIDRERLTWPSARPPGL